MDYFILPFSGEPYQIMYLPVSPEGRAFQAKVELRFLEGAGLWFLSVSDAVTGVSYVNRIPLVCSYEELNDLLFPFRWLFQGRGIGSMFCLKAVDAPASVNPGKENLHEFQVLWGNRWAEA